MTVDFLSENDRELWDVMCKKVGGGVYYTAGYHAAYEDCDRMAEAFVYRDGNDTLFHPYMRRPVREVAGSPVENGLYDIETVYGYTGPLSTSDDAAFIGAAWKAFGQHCRQTGIVAEFVRFDSFRRNHALFQGIAEIVDDRPTVAIPLHTAANAMWDSYPPVQRNRLRKGQARGLIYERLVPGDSVPIFARLYEETMQRVGAADWYFFGDDYFHRLFSELGHRVSLRAVRDGDELAAMAVFLHDDDILHYHLGASSQVALEHAPNNWLFHNAALEGAAHRQKWLHLGGGRTTARDDNLLRFKRTFSGDERMFRTGRRVHMAEAYEDLCARWIAAKAEEKRPPFFLLYRL